MLKPSDVVTKLTAEEEVLFKVWEEKIDETLRTFDESATVYFDGPKRVLNALLRAYQVHWNVQYQDTPADTPRLVFRIPSPPRSYR